MYVYPPPALIRAERMPHETFRSGRIYGKNYTYPSCKLPLSWYPRFYQNVSSIVPFIKFVRLNYENSINYPPRKI